MGDLRSAMESAIVRHGHCHGRPMERQGGSAERHGDYGRFSLGAFIKGAMDAPWTLHIGRSP